MKRPSFVFLLSLLAGTVALAAPMPVGPAAQSFPLGQFTLVALRDMVNAVPNNGSVFGRTWACPR